MGPSTIFLNFDFEFRIIFLNLRIESIYDIVYHSHTIHSDCKISSASYPAIEIDVDGDCPSNSNS